MSFKLYFCTNASLNNDKILYVCAHTHINLCLNTNSLLQRNGCFHVAKRYHLEYLGATIIRGFKYINLFLL